MKQILRALAFLTTTTAIFAQEDSADSAIPTLPTTVVTGELWESDLQNTTASVSVLGFEALADNGVQHFEDVINTIPNLTWTGGTSRPRYIQIRGIGENSQFEGETPDSSVRFLVDDLDLTGLGTVGNLFDVQQVEVLRGPQAGAFGANAAGGLIRIVTNDPTPYWTGQAEATVGNDNLRSGGIAVGGPLLESDPEQLSFRLALHKLAQDGFRENVFLDEDDTNERDELTTRFKLRWQPSESWQIDGQLFYADADNGYDEFTLNNNDEETYSDEPGRDEQETNGVSLKAGYDGFDTIEITYTGQYTDTDSLYSYDSDWGAGYLDPTIIGTPLESGYIGFLEVLRDREVSSHELRMDSKVRENALAWIDRWSFGIYHHKLDEYSDVDYRDEFGLGAATSDYETESTALFAQGSHDFTENTRIILGLRYENHEVAFASNVTEDYFGSLTPGFTESDTDDSLWGGKLTLEHDIAETHTVFASITRGYKAGGANSGAFREIGDPATYDTETLWNYEAGFRSEWFDSRLTSHVTAFYLYRDDPQLRDSQGSGGFFRYFTSNGNEAKHYGVEAEFTWFITKGWRASAGLGLLETEDDVGDELANAPTYTANARLSYEAESGFFASLEARTSDDYFESNNKNDRDQRVRDSFVTFDGSVGYRYNNWTLTLWTKNLFDEDYAERVFYFDNFDPDGGGEQRYEAPAAPRTFGVTANYRW